MSLKHLFPYISSIVLTLLCLSSAAQDTISNHIHVNQLGYPLGYSQHAIVNSPIMRPFHLLDTQSGKPVMKSFLKLVESNDAISGSSVWKADFGIIQSTGEYMVHIPGEGNSFPFQITPNPYPPLLKKVLKSFYFLRCGMELEKEYAGKFSRPACHLADGIVSATAAETPEIKNATGGWHEGGEYGKYTVSGAFTAGLLLTLYEYRPHLFEDTNLDIPESGNGIPDLLDEVRWEIEWLLKMQRPSGGIAHKLTALDSVSNTPPDKDKNKRFLYPASTNATAAACAVFAKASQIYSPYSATFAEQCQEAARSSWRFLEITTQEPGFTNPAGTLSKTYNDSDDSDERLWAALEMYLSTQNPHFLDVVNLLAERRIPFISASGYWGNVMPLAVASLIRASSDVVGEGVQNEARTNLGFLAKSIDEKAQKDGYNLSLKDGDFVWGSNAAILQNAVVLLLADHTSPNPSYRQSAMSHLHYILGCNPLSKCYVTGVGNNPPRHPHHPGSMHIKNQLPVPGLLVGGPNQFLNDSELKRHFNESSPPAITYKDSRDSYSSNDISISWNAALAFVIAFLVN